MTAEKVIHDPLTGLYNRRHLYDMFDREITHAERKNEPVSVIISDADRFKEINDTSELLKGVAAYPAHGETAEELIIKADKAMYQSKEKGRNCVTVWQEI